MRVYKYPLFLVADEQTIELPAVARIVHVHEQHDAPCLWAEVNPTAPITQRTFRVFATGEEIPPTGFSYVGTVHVGWTVWHVYEKDAR